MSESIAYANISISAADAFALFQVVCAENKYKITRKDDAAFSVHFKAWGFFADFGVSFEGIKGEECRMNATCRNNGVADNTPLLQASIIEPFIQKVNAKLVESAKSELASVPREQILHPEQHVAPDVAKWLADLEKSPSVYGRREAARALGKLKDTNQRITAALVMARDTDPHSDVSTDAGDALKAPVHQDIMTQNPAWAVQVMALSKLSKVDQVQNQVKAQQTSRVSQNSGRGTLISGAVMVFWGLVAVVVPSMGYQVQLFGSFPIGQIGGGILIVAGIVMAFLGLRKMES